MDALLVTSDLIIVSRVQGSAARRGIKLRTASTLREASEYLGNEPAEILLIDLSTQSVDVREFVEQARAAAGVNTHIIAFGPHVHEARLNAARQAGCHEVISRGHFLMQLDAILDRFKPG